MKLRIILEDDDGGEWVVSDWRRIMGSWTREWPGNPLAEHRFFEHRTTGERRLYSFAGADGVDGSRALTAKLLSAQLTRARVMGSDLPPSTPRRHPMDEFPVGEAARQNGSE